MNLFRRVSGASQVTLQSPLETTWLCPGRLELQPPPGGESYDLQEILSLVKMRCVLVTLLRLYCIIVFYQCAIPQKGCKHWPRLHGTNLTNLGGNL